MVYLLIVVVEKMLRKEWPKSGKYHKHYGVLNLELLVCLGLAGWFSQFTFVLGQGGSTTKQFVVVYIVYMIFVLQWSQNGTKRRH